jgi:aminoglycoside 3-N-acetyltransferase
MLAMLKPRIKALAAGTLWAYGPEDLIKRLRNCGVLPGSTLIVHSSWLQYNGFRGKPADLVRALKRAVGTDGLLVMTSMPYHNMSSAEWLARGKPMDSRRSPSMMGLVSEAFRRSEGVVRSLSATHPLLAWGSAATAFVAGHQDTDRPFGSASPFARLLERDAIILGFDAPFASFTFTHFVEDQLADTLQVPLYDPEPVCGRVVDQDGANSEQWVRVLSAQANSLRREHRLVEKLKKEGLLHQERIGHTSLIWIRARDLLAGARSLVAEGTHFFDAPDRKHG